MSYREELERVAREVGAGERSVAGAIHEAYLLGIQAHGDAVEAQAPEVYRLADKDGKLISPRRWSSVKRFYETVTGARRARQFGPEGCKVQAGRVLWEDV